MKAIAVDTGGTFTDMVVLDQETGALSVLKLPSTPSDPGQPAPAPSHGRKIAPAGPRSLNGPGFPARRRLRLLPRPIQ